MKKRGRPKKFRLPVPRIHLNRRIRLLLLKSKFFLLGLLTFALLFIFFQLNSFIQSLPNPELLTTAPFKATTKIFDRKGKLLYEIYGDENRTPVKLKEIPASIIEATIAIEDNEFFLHNGFSLKGIMRAVYKNLTSDTLEGGSTITQQLIRSAYLSPEKSLYRKIREVIVSVWAEQIYSKNQILEMYLNQVPYGGTAWGIEAASQTYFGKSVKEINLAESAFLAGLPAAPSRYSPFGAQPFDYKKRQLSVLLSMFKEGYINQDQLETATQKALHFISYRPRSTSEVRKNLEGKQIPSIVIEKVMKRLEKNSLLNDESFAKLWVDNRNDFHPRSRIALRMELKAKGISEELIDHVLENFDEDGLAYKAGIKYSNRLKKLDYPLFRKKLSSHLASKGFGYFSIEPVVEKIWNDFQIESNQMELNIKEEIT